ncbi:hypothetical protein GF314_08305 [bacterium]|nr:hypothetical protein [bacterium]
MAGDMPMPPDRFQQLKRAQERKPRPDPLHAVDRRDPAVETSPLAAELLAEAASHPLESGELLVLSEEAALPDLEAAASGIETTEAVPDRGADEPALAAIARPRLLAARVDEIIGWEPPLAEHLRLLEAALQSGLEVAQTMLVGHVETFPERVEHLMRLRHMLEPGAGRLVLTIRLSGDRELPPRDPRIGRVAAAARPADPDLEVRHARAIARLALGPGIVVG